MHQQKINFDDFSNQLVNLIDELKINKIHLVGFSIGSLIARNFATKFSDRLESLILLGSIYKRSEEQQKIVNDCVEKKISLSKLQSSIWEKSNSSVESFSMADLDDDLIQNLIEKDVAIEEGMYKMK